MEEGGEKGEEKKEEREGGVEKRGREGGEGEALILKRKFHEMKSGIILSH